MCCWGLVGLVPGSCVVEVGPIHAGSPLVDGVLGVGSMLGVGKELSDLGIGDRCREQLSGSGWELGVPIQPPQDRFDLVI